MTLKKTNNNIITTNSTFQKLSIQLSLDGLSFCTLNVLEETVDRFEYLPVKSPQTPESLLKEADLFFKNHHIFSNNYKDVLVIHDNELSALVPNAFFNPSEIATYLKFNVKIYETDSIAYDVISNAEITNVYVPFANINNYFFEAFGEFEFKHCNTVLLEKLFRERQDQHHTVMYALIAERYFHFIILKDRKLLFNNRFTYQTPEDFLYYILFTAEQLNLNPDQIPLKLAGDIKAGDPLYSLAYNYVRNIDFVSDTEDIFPDSGQTSAPGEQFHKFTLAGSL